MLAAGQGTDVQRQPHTALTSNGGLWCRARRLAGPVSSGLEASCGAGCYSAVVDLIRGSPFEHRVRPVAFVPGDIQRYLPSKGSGIVGDKKSPRALDLHRPDEALDDCDTSMLAVVVHRKFVVKGSRKCHQMWCQASMLRGGSVM